MPVSLFQHQKEIVAEDPKRTGLFLGTGGGKTRTALMLAQGKILIVCPKTQYLDRNWPRELEKMGIEKDITVISKEQFRRDHKELPPVDTFIIDEAETCLGVTPNTRQKNNVKIPKASQLFEAVQWYVNKHEPERVYLCTATITRSPMTVWAAATILGKKWNWEKWRDTFYILLAIPHRTIYTVDNSQESKDRLAKAVHKIGYVGRLEDWFDVPDQIYKNDYVELTTEQTKRLKEIRTEFPDAIVQVGKRLQIENGVLSGDEYNDPETYKDNKLERIFHYAEEFPRLIIFAKYTLQLNRYYEELTKKGYTVFLLNGQTKDREALFRDLKNADKAILLAQAQISAGWEWKECPAMVFASRTYSIADYEQGLGRIQRTDAIKKNIYINLIARGGVDAALDSTLVNKKDFSERVFLEKEL